MITILFSFLAPAETSGFSPSKLTEVPRNSKIAEGNAEPAENERELVIIYGGCRSKNVL
jgi:hypothetical protein